MDFIGSNFLDIRNRYIIPMVSYGVPVGKTEFWALKDIFTNNIISINKISAKSIEIELSKDDYYKAICCDIELFMNKVYIQYSDFNKSKHNSPCWSFVTLYYLSFFLITCFFRFIGRGFIYLTSEHKTRLEQFYLAVYSLPIVLESGNYYFSFKEENSNGNIVIVLSFKSDSVHRTSWLQFEKVLKDFLPSCDDDEKVTYSAFVNLFNLFKADFPSSLRNKLNYHGDSSLLDLDNLVEHIDMKKVDSNFFKGLLSFDSRVSIKNQINSISYLVSFLFKMNNELHKEYLSRSKYGKDFDSKRRKYLTADVKSQN